MRVLIDTNIVLDYLLDREPFLQDSQALFNLIDSGQVVGYVTATTLTDIFGVAYLRDDFASFVGWASCPSLVFQGSRVAHPTRIIP
ncbi:PIN domain-containing protein [Nostoc sp. PCC 9305]|uniref:PIN domain-containing protein n=1 Tax=Nostoc sp. PCC 9305 TaxID=296636 RepID=UPI0039C62B95